jgi:hypothetical protein
VFVAVGIGLAVGGAGVTVAVAEGVGVAVSVGVRVGDAVAVRVDVNVGVRLGVNVGVRVAEAVDVRVAVGVRVALEVKVSVGGMKVPVGVALRVNVIVGVKVRVGVGVEVGVKVGVAERVGVAEITDVTVAVTDETGVADVMVGVGDADVGVPVPVGVDALVTAGEAVGDTDTSAVGLVPGVSVEDGTRVGDSVLEMGAVGGSLKQATPRNASEKTGPTSRQLEPELDGARPPPGARPCALTMCWIL